MTGEALEESVVTVRVPVIGVVLNPRSIFYMIRILWFISYIYCLLYYIFGPLARTNNMDILNPTTSIKNLRQIQAVRNYQKCAVKWMNTELQFNYMDTTRKNGCIPKGIHDQATFVVSVHNEDLQKQCL